MNENNANRILLELYMQAQDLHVDEFCSVGLGAMKAILPFDSAIVGEGHRLPNGRLVVTSMHLHNQPLQKWHDYERVGHQDLAAKKAAENNGRPTTFDSRWLSSKGPQAELRDYVLKYEVRHALMVFAPSRAPAGGRAHRLRAVSLWRAREQAAFAAHEELASAVVFDHFMRARELNQSWALSNQAVLDEGTTTVISDTNGRILASDLLCSHLLGSEWPGWTGPFLPHDLVDALQRPGMTYEGHYLRAAVKAFGRQLVIQLSSTPSLPGLTQAESVVARVVATPMTYKSAATTLGIAPSTVRNHLHAIYAKLGVHSKEELMTLIMRGRMRR